MKTLLMLILLSVLGVANAYDNSFECGIDDVSITVGDKLSVMLTNCGAPRTLLTTGSSSYLTYLDVKRNRIITVTVVDGIITSVE